MLHTKSEWMHVYFCLYLLVSMVWPVKYHKTNATKTHKKKNAEKKHTHRANEIHSHSPFVCASDEPEDVWESNFTCTKLKMETNKCRKSNNELVLLISKMWIDQLIVRSCRCSSLSINFQFSFASIVPSIDNAARWYRRTWISLCCLCPFFLLSVIVTKWHNKWNS